MVAMMLLVLLQLAFGSSVLFMQGDSQALAPNTLWSMDIDTHSIRKLGSSTKMFTSHGALCGGIYYSIYWELPDPTNPFGRSFGLASFNLHQTNATFIETSLPNDYYGVWCAPDEQGALGDSLLVVMAKKPNPDALRATHFYVQSLSLNAKRFTTLAGV